MSTNIVYTTIDGQNCILSISSDPGILGSSDNGFCRVNEANLKNIAVKQRNSARPH